MNQNVFGSKTTKINKNAANENLLDKRLAELREYNKIHGTHLSYGKFVAKFYSKNWR